MSSSGLVGRTEIMFGGITIAAKTQLPSLLVFMTDP
jgi:hypothetical protein